MNDLEKPTEQLGRDADGNWSSQGVIKTGENRGRRKPEKGGKWIYAGGYAHEARQDEKIAHASWLKAIKKLGLRLGMCGGDGVVSYFIFQAGEEEKQKSKKSTKKEKGLKELVSMTEEFGGYKKEQEMLKPCPDCGADTQGTWIRIDQEDIWHVGCTRCSWQPYGTE